METKKEESKFKKGYKGKGMCSHCAFSESKQFYAGGPQNLLCGWYASPARSVSRNCNGIRSLK